MIKSNRTLAIKQQAHCNWTSSSTKNGFSHLSKMGFRLKTRTYHLKWKIYIFSKACSFLAWKRWFNFLTAQLRYHMPERVCLKGGVPEALCGDSDLPTGPPRGFCSIICWIKCGGAGGDCRIIGLAWGWRGWNQNKPKVRTQRKTSLQFSCLIHPVQFMRPMPLGQGTGLLV